MSAERIFTAQELLDCAERELRLRRRVYPRQVQAGRMTQKLATTEIAKMEAIVALLEERAIGERLF